MVAKSLSQITTESSQVKHRDLLLVSEKQPDWSYVSNKVKFSNMLKNSDSYFSGDLSKWNAAKARGVSNPARFAFIGDSNVAGEGSGSGARGLSGAISTGFPRLFSQLAGFNVDSVFGTQYVDTILYTVYDPRVSFGSGWGADAALSDIVGGSFFVANGGSTGQLVFNPVGAFIKFRVWYPTLSGLNTGIKVYVDDVLIDTFTESLAGGFTYKEYTVTDATHKISIGCGSTGTAFIAGIETFKSTGEPVIIQGGTCSARTTMLEKSNEAWNFARSIVSIAPDFTLLYLTINDAGDNAAVATYYTRVENFVKSLPNSNGCLCVGFPFNSTKNLDGTIDSYGQSLKNIARDYGWFYFDSREVFGRSHNKANTNGLAFDANHPNANGHNILATQLYEFLKGIGI